MIIKGEFRQPSYCPAPAPYIECPRGIIIGRPSGNEPCWISVTNCQTCSFRKRLTIGRGPFAIIEVDCLADGICQIRF